VGRFCDLGVSQALALVSSILESQRQVFPQWNILISSNVSSSLASNRGSRWPTPINWNFTYTSAAANPRRFVLTDFCKVVQRQSQELSLVESKIVFNFLSFHAEFEGFIVGAQGRLVSHFSLRLRLSFRSNFHLVSNPKENDRSHHKNQNEQDNGSFNGGVICGRAHVFNAGSEKKSCPVERPIDSSVREIVPKSR
jgi:hypothetical protein